MEPSRRRALVVIAITLLFAATAAWFYSLPYLAAIGMKEAAEKNDATQLSAYVDFPSVKESLKASVNAAIALKVVANDKDAEPFSTIGTALAAALVNPIIDALATPESLAMIMRGDTPQTGKAVAPSGQIAERKLDADAEMRYLRFDQFAIDIRKKGTSQPPVVLVLARNGLFTWKLTSIRLPPEQIGSAPASLAARSQTPQSAGRVTDLGAVLSAQESQLLTQSLGDYERETTHQIAVLTVASLSGESIEVFSLRVAKSWALGRKGIDNGILVVLAPKERKVRIELGRGFERYITDAKAQEIINTQMLPAFRQGEYSKGLELGLQKIMKEGRSLHSPT